MHRCIEIVRKIVTTTKKNLFFPYDREKGRTKWKKCKNIKCENLNLDSFPISHPIVCRKNKLRMFFSLLLEKPKAGIDAHMNCTCNWAHIFIYLCFFSSSLLFAMKMNWIAENIWIMKVTCISIGSFHIQSDNSRFVYFSISLWKRKRKKKLALKKFCVLNPNHKKPLADDMFV